MQKNDLFDIFPEFSKVVHILAVIPATSRCSAERSFSCAVSARNSLRNAAAKCSKEYQ